MGGCNRNRPPNPPRSCFTRFTRCTGDQVAQLSVPHRSPPLRRTPHVILIYLIYFFDLYCMIASVGPLFNG